jgi:hypothetical protein
MSVPTCVKQFIIKAITLFLPTSQAKKEKLQTSVCLPIKNVINTMPE